MVHINMQVQEQQCVYFCSVSQGRIQGGGALGAEAPPSLLGFT